MFWNACVDPTENTASTTASTLNFQLLLWLLRFFRHQTSRETITASATTRPENGRIYLVRPAPFRLLVTVEHRIGNAVAGKVVTADQHQIQNDIQTEEKQQQGKPHAPRRGPPDIEENGRYKEQE